MSAQELQAPPLRGYVRNSRRRNMALDVDLNEVPAMMNSNQEGTSTNSRNQEGTSTLARNQGSTSAHAGSQVGTSACAGSREEQSGQQRHFKQPALIDVEAFDDDVIVSSAGAFAEAKNNSRRNHGRSQRTGVVDVDSEEWSSRLMNNNHKRRRVSGNQTIINCDLYINLEGSSNSMKENARIVSVPPPPPPPPPKELTFSCPVCMGPLVEEMSTKCGHIFCKPCIKAAIAAQSKCPTCRRKMTMKDTIRVYLPAAR